MAFNKFLFILLGVLGFYYLVVILLDLAKGGKKVVSANEDVHKVEFGEEEKPIDVSSLGESKIPVASLAETVSSGNIVEKKNNIAESNTGGEDGKVDMSLEEWGETVNGNPIETTQENIMKYMQFA